MYDVRNVFKKRIGIKNKKVTRHILITELKRMIFGFQIKQHRWKREISKMSNMPGYQKRNLQSLFNELLMSFIRRCVYENRNDLFRNSLHHWNVCRLWNQ